MTNTQPQPMTEETLGAFLDNELRNTIGTNQAGDEISADRAKNLSMYLNRPVGDEEAGRSKVQSSAVHDVIEALLPATLAPFISAEKVVDVTPVGVDDEAYAEQCGAYLNHVFMVDNDGVKIQYVWQKDGLLQKNGFVFADWCDKKKTERKTQKVDAFGFMQIVNDPEIEVIKYAGFAGGQEVDPKALEQMIAGSSPDIAVIEFEIDYRRTYTDGRVVIQNIPPEHVIVSKTAKDETGARLIGFQDQVTLSDLREEGYDEAKLEKINFGEELEYDPSNERSVREQAQGGNVSDHMDSTDPASRMAWRTVVWTRVDFDGDGKAELRKIIRAGQKSNGGVIIYNEEADEVPIVSFTPVIMPHQIFGRCPADQAREAQEAETAMLRMAMDATYHTVYPRWSVADDGMTDDTWDDLMNNIPGAPVRVRAQGAISPLRDAPDIGAAYNMLEYWERVKERRTPITRQDSGVDVDALNNKSATQSQIQANASSVRKELILRLYAESLSKLFRIINRIVIKNQDKSRLLRLFPNKEPVNVDPRYWNADMDVRVRVGLGSGTKDQQLQALMAINQIQMGDLQMGLPTVDPVKLFNTRSRLIEYSGLSSPELYFNNPDDAAQGGMPPEMQATLQQETQKAFDAGMAQGGDQIKAMEIASKEKMQQLDLQIKQLDLQIKHEAAKMASENNKSDAEIEMARLMQERELKLMEIAANERMKKMDVQVKALDEINQAAARREDMQQQQAPIGDIARTIAETT